MLPREAKGRWLDRFSAVAPIACQGGLQVYRGLQEDRPRVVAVGRPDEPVERVRARLDGIAAAHAQLGHPRIPRVVERGRVGEVEFLSLDCEAPATMQALLLDLEQRTGPIDEARFGAAMLAIGASVAAAHATRDVTTGAPICLGVVGWWKVLLAPDGEIWVWGFGDRFVEKRLSMRDSVGTYVAPEVVRGALPTPPADVYAIYQLIQSVHDTMLPPEKLQRVLAGFAAPEDRELGKLFADFQMRMFSGNPQTRIQSVAEALAVAGRMWDLTGEQPDPAALRETIVELCTRITDRTLVRPLGAGVASHMWDNGRYRGERDLGKGSMGTVHLAWDRELEQHVAIKTLRSDADAGLKQRFVREVRLLRKLRHPNLVSGYDIVTNGDELAAVMEYVPGPALTQVIASLQADARRAAGTVAAIADALACLHEAGVVHRDVKPANVIVHERRGPVLVDLGVAAEVGSQLTHSGILIGTPLYMSPEQLAGAETDASSDVYAAGIVLLEALRGSHPFAATSLYEAVTRRAQAIDPLLDEHVPAALHPLIQRALAPGAADRCTAAELRDGLRRFALS